MQNNVTNFKVQTNNRKNVKEQKLAK